MSLLAPSKSCVMSSVLKILNSVVFMCCTFWLMHKFTALMDAALAHFKANVHKVGEGQCNMLFNCVGNSYNCFDGCSF